MSEAQILLYNFKDENRLRQIRRSSVGLADQSIDPDNHVRQGEKGMNAAHQGFRSHESLKS